MAIAVIAAVSVMLAIGLRVRSADSGALQETAPRTTSEHITATKMVGQWQILAIDGKRHIRLSETGIDRRVSSASFSEGRFRATIGCNELGGLGLFDSGRYFTSSGPQTTKLSTPRLMAEEEILDAVLRANPRIEFQGDRRLVLSGRGHKLELGQRSTLSVHDQNPVPNFVGTVWILSEVDGVKFAPASARKLTASISFKTNTWAADDGCLVATGNYRQVGSRLVNTSVIVSNARPQCSTKNQAVAVLAKMMAGTVQVAVGRTGSLLMVGDKRQLSGHFEPEKNKRQHLH